MGLITPARRATPSPLQVAGVKSLQNSSRACCTLAWSRAGAACIASPGRPFHLVGADQIMLRRSQRRWRSRRVSQAFAVSIQP
jgi:hypothetical protein